MANRLALAVNATVTVIALGGCTTSAGTPSAAGTGSASDGTPTTTGSTSAPTVSLPPRPADLPVAERDPCTLLTPAQQRELGVDVPPTRAELEAPAVGCHFDRLIGKPGYGYLVSYRTDRDVDYWLSGPERGRAIPITVAGYPGVQYGLANPYQDPRNQGSQVCFAAVDVAERQQLVVQFGPSDQDELPGLDAKCVKAKQVAEIVLQNLQQGG